MGVSICPSTCIGSDKNNVGHHSPDHTIIRTISILYNGHLKQSRFIGFCYNKAFISSAGQVLIIFIIKNIFVIDLSAYDTVTNLDTGTGKQTQII